MLLVQVVAHSLYCIGLLQWPVLTLFFFFISVSKPAPSFNGTAVIDGKFQQIKLSDFKGKSCMLAGTIVISL